MSGETWWKKRKKEAAGKIGDLIRRIRLRRRRKEKGNESGCGKEAEAPWENPFLAYSRQVMEAVLRRKGMDYRAFRPIVIDTDMPGQHFGEEDDVVDERVEPPLPLTGRCDDQRAVVPDRAVAARALQKRDPLPCSFVRQEELEHEGGEEQITVIGLFFQMRIQDSFKPAPVENVFPHADTVEQARAEQLPPLVPEPCGQRNAESAFRPPRKPFRQIFFKGVRKNPLPDAVSLIRSMPRTAVSGSRSFFG